VLDSVVRWEYRVQRLANALTLAEPEWERRCREEAQEEAAAGRDRSLRSALRQWFLADQRLGYQRLRALRAVQQDEAGRAAAERTYRSGCRTADEALARRQALR
jgi:hypothetical protein